MNIQLKKCNNLCGGCVHHMWYYGDQDACGQSVDCHGVQQPVLQDDDVDAEDAEETGSLEGYLDVRVGAKP